MKTLYFIFLFILIQGIVACNSHTTSQKTHQQDTIKSSTPVFDTITKKKVNYYVDTVEISPTFVEQLSHLDAKKWIQHAYFQGDFSVDSAMYLIFGKYYLHLEDSYNDDEVIDVAIWKLKNYPIKTYEGDWTGEYCIFPDTLAKINETHILGDTIVQVSNKKYAIISTSTLACTFPSLDGGTGRFTRAFLGIAMFEQKNNT